MQSKCEQKNNQSEQIETNSEQNSNRKNMASNTKVTAGKQAINWAEVRRDDPDSYYTFHDDDGELDTLALLRGIHNIQEAGGDGAAEQRFLDRVGFKPMSAPTSRGNSDSAAEQRPRESAAAAAEPEFPRQVVPPVGHTGQKPAAKAYDAATQREVAQLKEVVRDLDVPGAPPSITLPQAFVSESAFSAHVEGRVREAVMEACTAFECEREEWRRTEAAYRRELLSENRLLEAVLRKYKVSILDARAALAELDAADPVEPPPTPPATPAVSPEATTIERAPSYVRFQTMATRGRRAGRSRRHRKRAGAWCAP